MAIIMKKSRVLFMIGMATAIFSNVNANPIVPRWFLVDQECPTRFYMKSAFDFSRETVVAFGGEDSLGQYPSDTWEWSGGWTQHQAPGPNGRIGHGICYDTGHCISLLFGGQNQDGQYLNDLWSWDGNSWVLLQTGGPSPRAFFVFAYDQFRQKAVLFGGIDSSGILGDTWEWNGTQWEERIIDGPPARMQSAMAFYEWNQSNIWYHNLVLFGGKSDISGDYLSDTWILNQNGWQQVICQNEPSSRSGHVMAYDDYFTGSLILHGGSYGGNDSMFYDTWLFYGADWESMEYISYKPSPRKDFDICQRPFGRDGESILLIGGRNDSRILNQTWTFPVWRNYILGDINNDSAFNGLDLIYGINYFKGGDQPPYSMECNFSVWYVAGDINGSCSFNGLDITYGVRYFKGGPAPHPCPACPE